ncbi:MAG: hypothetical protein NTU44_17605, partial [Bacteroidetes bacterium]|nr:hypothetical protein [Bacteroidota bacterium]
MKSIFWFTKTLMVPKRYLFFLLLPYLVMVSCNQNGKNRAVSRDQPPPLQIHILRYENALFSLDRSHLKEGVGKLLPEYSFFLGKGLND